MDRNEEFVPRGFRDIDQRIAIPLAVIKVGSRVKAAATSLTEVVGMPKTEAEASFLVESVPNRR